MELLKPVSLWGAWVAKSAKELVSLTAGFANELLKSVAVPAGEALPPHCVHIGPTDRFSSALSLCPVCIHQPVSSTGQGPSLSPLHP